MSSPLYIIIFLYEILFLNTRLYMVMWYTHGTCHEHPSLIIVYELDILFRVQMKGSTNPITSKIIGINNWLEPDIFLPVLSLSTTNIELSLCLMHQ